MPATVQLLGWKAEGLRCPDHEISCVDGNDQPHAVTLVQMPNGTGKTTTLNLLRLALSGRWHTSPPPHTELRKFMKKGSRDSGMFEVRLRLNTSRVTIQMAFDFATDRVRYRTTRGQGQVDGFDPPVEFRRFLNDNFVNFFVFDGELAQHLLDDERSDAEGVVEALFQLNALHRLGRKVGAYWDRMAEIETGDERTKKSRENKLRRCRERLSLLTCQRLDLQRRAKSTSERLDAQRRAYEDELKKGAETARLIEAASKLAREASDKVRDQANEALDAMRDPHALAAAFAADIYELKTNLDRAKLPGTAAREFFHDLAYEEFCVCGREIDDAIAEEIRTRAAQYLGSDEVGFLNSMKSDIEEAVGASRSAPSEALVAKLSELDARVRSEQEARNELEELTVAAENADPAVARAKEEIDRLSDELLKIELDLERFEDKDTSRTIDATWGIDVMEKRVLASEKKLGQTERSLKLRQKRDVLTEILGEAHRLARAGVVAEICSDANRLIAQLLPHNDIRIERIERCLVLEGQEGGSIGETLSIAYGFLATLFDRADHRLPFVVDSPAGPIDLEVRPKIGALVPRLSRQFVAFTISSERDRFVARLKAASREPVQFLTVFRKGPVSVEAEARATNAARETADGFVVAGEAFFDAFQMEREEEAA